MLESLSLNAFRRKRRALESMLGLFPERNIRALTKRVREVGLLDQEWSRANNAIFVHVPKNAGSSVQVALGIHRRILRHPPAEALRRADPEFYEQAYSFAFSRNPWDRLVSCFHFIANSSHPFNQLVATTDLHGITDFDAFLRLLRNPIARHQVVSRVHFIPQAHYLCDVAGKLIVDRIGKFEDLPDSFDYLVEPLAGKFELPQRGKPPTRDYRSFYKENWQVELVGRMYAEDCRLFGYSFDA